MSDNFDQYRYINQLSASCKLKRLIWRFVWFVFFQFTPSWCLDQWRLFLLSSFGAKVGKGCRVASTVRVWAPWNLVMGDYVCLAEAVDLYCVSPIHLGNKVTISQRTFLCSASHDVTSLTRPLIHAPIAIKDHAWICAEAFVGPGIIIAEGAVVGARAVVTKNVEPWTIVAGNPAKFIKKRVLEQQSEGA